jgi:8-oxo-dGTP pyrophosphatase MutT (NUDIX family)
MKFTTFLEKYKFINEREYYGNLGAGVIPYALDTNKFLLSLRSKEVNEPGTWGIIGGKVEDDEANPKLAALREAHEEIGLEIPESALNLIYVYNSAEKDENGDSIFSYYTFLANLDNEVPELETKEYGWETDTCKWFSLDEIKKLKNVHFGVKALLKNKALEKAFQS